MINNEKNIKYLKDMFKKLFNVVLNRKYTSATYVLFTTYDVNITILYRLYEREIVLWVNNESLVINYEDVLTEEHIFDLARYIPEIKPIFRKLQIQKL